MKLNKFKDMLFDLINESDEINVSSIALNEKKNLLVAYFSDGTEYALHIMPVSELSKEDREGLVVL